MKAFVVVVLITIVAALFTALVFMYRDRGKSSRMVTALAVRVGLSVGLIVFLIVSYWLGWIGPQGLR
ncbi:MAG TPA: twin transmembrane helix small protein [Casimicrobiaceae bacterium]|nr:twin transmembrane helix small protein [Casimicrobiaceae bacterium]